MVERLWGHLASLRQGTQPTGDSYMLWGGDFNCHHPMWDEEQNCHLFTAAALREADKLLVLVADYGMPPGMEMLLPKNVPTLEAMVTKNWTHPDNIFGSDNLGDKVIYCTTDLWLRGPGTDHVPILTVLELPLVRAMNAVMYNFHESNGGAYGENGRAARVGGDSIQTGLYRRSEWTGGGHTGDNRCEGTKIQALPILEVMVEQGAGGAKEKEKESKQRVI